MTAAETLMPGPSRGRRAEWWLRLAVFGIGAVAVFQLLRSANFAHVGELVQRAGWPLLVVLLPTGVAMAVDAEGWRLILRALGHSLSWAPLLRARLAVESIVLSAPAGPVAGEAMKVGLLNWRAGVPVTAGAASLALTKACLWASEALYLVIASAAFLAGGGPSRRVLLPLTLGGAAIVATLATLAFALLKGGAWASGLGAQLARIPITRFRRWIEARRDDLASLDRTARSFFEAPWSLRLRCLATFTVEWLVEGLETFLILRCVGVSIGVGEALTLDAVTSLLRAFAFFVPAGLGIQDVTQLLMLRQLGVTDATATAGTLIVVKRTKEVFWVFTGSLFLAGRRKP
jgi:uncharacterized protein (TIRG00374 family)